MGGCGILLFGFMRSEALGGMDYLIPMGCDGYEFGRHFKESIKFREDRVAMLCV